MKAFMKKLPKSLRVGPYDFAIRLMSDAQSTGQGAFGMFSQSEAKIVLHENLVSKVLAVDTLLHEISHAIFWAYHVKPDDGEERTVSVFGTAWAQIYRDNPTLLDWIAEGVGHA